MMRNPKDLLLWGLVALAAGLIFSSISIIRLLSWLAIPSPVPPTFWHLPLVMLALTVICFVAGIILIVLDLITGANKK